MLAGTAHASTGNFMPIVLSVLIAIPLLLLVPAIAIACRSAYTWDARKRWAGGALLVAVASFGSLWWAMAYHSLVSGQHWYVAYLWALPPYLFWIYAARQMKR